MATQVQFRRGTTADISTFIGADGEVVVDTTKKTCVVNDGVQIAGYPLLREDGSNSALNVGSLSSCALKFINDPNTGIISPGADQIALVTGGASRLSVDSSGSVTIPGNLLVSGAFTGSITFDNGSAAVPALRFTNDPDTGIYLAGTNQVAISTGGTQRLTTTTTEVTSTLPVIHPLGAAATPSLTFTGDTNTGIYSPGADQVAISTNGTGRLFIDADGSIGAGTTSTSGYNLRLSKNLTGGSGFARGASLISTVQSDVTGNAWGFQSEVGVQDASFTLPELVHFYARQGTKGASATLTAQYGFNAASSITGATNNYGFYSNIATGTGRWNFYSAGTADSYFASNNFIFANGGTERARIDSSGRLGLGTSSPNALLEVAGNSGTTTPTLRISNLFTGTPTELSQTALEFYSGDGSTPAGASVRAKIDVLTNANGGNTDALRFFVPNASGALSEVAQFTNAGRVGIGTTSPSKTLDVRGDVRFGEADANACSIELGSGATGDRAAFIDLTGDTTYTDYGFRMERTSGGANGISRFLHRGTGEFRLIAQEAAPIVFWTSNGEKARIDSSGRLLVGTSSARDALSAVASPFQIEGTGIATAGISVTRSSNNADGPAIWIAKNRGGIGTNATVVNGDELGSINFTGNNGSSQIQGASIRAFADGTVSGGGANDLPGRLVFSTTADGASSPTERMRITSAGNVGIGTTDTPAEKLEVRDGNIGLDSAGSAVGDRTTERFYKRTDNGSSNGMAAIGMNGAGTNGFLGEIKFYTGASDVFNASLSERARIDSSGRLLVGTSTSVGASGLSTPQVQFSQNGASSESVTSLTTWCGTSTGFASQLHFRRSYSDTLGTHTVVVDGARLGTIRFTGSDGTDFKQAATIFAEVDGTPGTNDMPGRIVFSTTADGASSPTERMRIRQDGIVCVGSAGVSIGSTTDTGINLEGGGVIACAASATTPLYVARRTDDGELVRFYQAGTLEGTISVSGTTVSYNGAHLSRWSQLPGGAEREEILRGTVLSNIDEMCDWGEEDNEQLNRMKVSDVEGDPNVAGVFQSWDDDDDTYTDDFYCAMTGDFIIRISAGIPVHRGQLLMSAGDGTAKPQDDDIIRSKTIAKVTSNHVTCTYDDGSYCVPCVLMAC